MITLRGTHLKAFRAQQSAKPLHTFCFADEIDSAIITAESRSAHFTLWCTPYPVARTCNALCAQAEPHHLAKPRSRLATVRSVRGTLEYYVIRRYSIVLVGASWMHRPISRCVFSGFCPLDREMGAWGGARAERHGGLFSARRALRCICAEDARQMGCVSPPD